MEHVDGFHAFPAFPDTDVLYRSDTLFHFFANRVMSPRRPDFDDYLEALGLTRGESNPIELLARSGGQRATGSVQVVADRAARPRPGVVHSSAR